MEKPLMRSLKDSRSGISQTTVCSFVNSFFHVISNSLHIPWALPYHKALRGTIITLGTFSKGCIDAALYAGAAPIGLIDGEKLLDLLMEYAIGVKKSSISLYEIDEEYLSASDTSPGSRGNVEKRD